MMWSMSGVQSSTCCMLLGVYAVVFTFSSKPPGWPRLARNLSARVDGLFPNLRSDSKVRLGDNQAQGTKEKAKAGPRHLSWPPSWCLEPGSPKRTFGSARKLGKEPVNSCAQANPIFCFLFQQTNTKQTPGKKKSPQRS